MENKLKEHIDKLLKNRLKESIDRELDKIKNVYICIFYAVNYSWNDG